MEPRILFRSEWELIPPAFRPQITGNIRRRVCIPPVLFYINCFEFECERGEQNPLPDRDAACRGAELTGSSERRQSGASCTNAYLQGNGTLSENCCINKSESNWPHGGRSRNASAEP